MSGPARVGCAGDRLHLRDWDYLNYQINETDVIIMGNGTDVMKKWDGTTFGNLGGTPPVAKSISIHAERLWATGVKSIPQYGDYYSDDLNPENWTGGEDAAGEIYLPTWGRGVCIGVSTIFSDLVIFKTNNIYAWWVHIRPCMKSKRSIPLSAQSRSAPSCRQMTARSSCRKTACTTTTACLRTLAWGYGKGHCNQPVLCFTGGQHRL